MIESLLLPTMDSADRDRAAATAEQLGADLTLALQAPAKSIDGRTRAIETYSPLFRDSSANLQPNLFGAGELEAPAPKPIAGASVRHFARCRGNVVQLGDFGICPQCSQRHKTLRRIKYSNSASAHVCDPRCMGALGPDCECACGGANHGSWHDSPAPEVEQLFD